jgi:hypothetical protein
MVQAVTLGSMAVVRVEEEDLEDPMGALLVHPMAGMVATAANTVVVAVLVEIIQAIYHPQTAAAVGQCVLSGPEHHALSHQPIPATYNWKKS